MTNTPLFDDVQAETGFDASLLDPRPKWSFKDAVAEADRALYAKQQPGNGKRQKKAKR